MSKFSTLIVEDTPDFQEIYRRAVERKEGEPIIASSYNEAVEIIRRRYFPVAIVDVRLSEDDETNADGLKVLKFIQEIGDRTSAILITGYGTFQVGREAFKKYDVFEGLEKGVALSVIEDTIANAYQQAAKYSSKDKVNYSPVLKGRDAPLWEWEDRVLRACSPRDGAQGLYRFFDTFLRDLSPLVRHATAPGCLVSQSNKAAAGLFWSRSVGRPILIAFGQKAELAKLEGKSIIPELSEFFPTVALPKLGAIVKRTDSNGVHGFAQLLEDEDAASFELGKLTR